MGRFYDPVQNSIDCHKYREKNVVRLTEKRKLCRLEKRNYVAEVKTSPCIDCGNIYCKEAMTFDHRLDEIKLYDIYRLTNHPTADLNKLKAEIQKCDLVCVGCHRGRTNSRLSEYVKSCPNHRPNFDQNCKCCIHYKNLAILRGKRLSLVREFKNKPCFDCGGEFDPWKMDLDHIHGKLDNISNLLGSQASLKRITDELGKCEVVCCWCHVNRTMSRRNLDGERS